MPPDGARLHAGPPMNRKSAPLGGKPHQAAGRELLCGTLRAKPVAKHTPQATTTPFQPNVSSLRTSLLLTRNHVRPRPCSPSRSEAAPCSICTCQGLVPPQAWAGASAGATRRCRLGKLPLHPKFGRDCRLLRRGLGRSRLPDCASLQPKKGNKHKHRPRPQTCCSLTLAKGLLALCFVFLGPTLWVEGACLLPACCCAWPRNKRAPSTDGIAWPQISCSRKAAGQGNQASWAQANYLAGWAQPGGYLQQTLFCRIGAQ